jgi:N-acetylmuramoyl-L-alanine amidase
VWMADVLRAAGCQVVEEPGWETRGRPRPFAPIGVMLHHDASPAGQTSNGADVIVNGRPGLKGPLGNLWLAYDGTWHCCAAGSANHAGEGDGSWGDIDDGNHDTIGIETDHTTDEDWTTGQQSSALRGVDALRRRLGMTDAQVGRRILAHKEWAPSRKVDPDPMDMDRARAQLLAYDPAAEETFVQQIRKKNTVAQVIEADGDWHTIRLSRSDDPTGVYGVAPGPFHYLLDAHLTTAEMPAGAVLMVRAVNTEGDADDVVADAPIASCVASTRAAQHFAYSAQDHTDQGQWLRVQVQTTQQVSLTLVETSTTTW